MSKLHWIMETSLLKTLANKHQTSVSKEAKRLRTTVDTDQGPRKCLQIKVERKRKAPLVARFGGIPLVRKIKANLIDRDIRSWRPKGTELIKRLLSDECEIGG